MNPTQKIIAAAAAFLVGAISFPLARGMFNAPAVKGGALTQSTFNGPVGTSDMLTKACDELNKLLPMMVDPYTRWDNTYAVGSKTMVYKYTIVGIPAANLNTAQLKSKLRPKLVETYRTHPAMSQLRDASIALRYTYFDEKGALITSMEIGPDDL